MGREREADRQRERRRERERERRTHHTVPWRESEWTKIFCERKPEGEGRIGRHARQRETKAAEKPAEGQGREEELAGRRRTKRAFHVAKHNEDESRERETSEELE